MNYQFSTKVRDNDTLRASFNDLTRRTFGFDFEDWYTSGHWGDWYIPHVLLDGDRVVSNVSVNLMQFDLGGVTKNYIQLGTVMTDEAYRGQGLNRQIMERILEEYAGRVDGIYLYGNDEVLDYYPRFGFQPAKEYEYYLRGEALRQASPYSLCNVDCSIADEAEALYQTIRDYRIDACAPNQNDELYMSENISLYQFWLAAGFGDQVYYLPEIGNYVVAELDGDVLFVHQVFGKTEVDIHRLAAAFGNDVREVVLGYTPVKKELFSVREHREEDCTFFIFGNDLLCIEEGRRIFPVLSHA